MPESIIKLLNMRSIHKEAVSSIWVGSLITWYNPDRDVILSVTLTSKVDLS